MGALGTVPEVGGGELGVQDHQKATCPTPAANAATPHVH